MADKLKAINTLSRLGLAFVFLYHGLVPKLLWLHPTEVVLVEAHHLSVPSHWVSSGAGILEVILSFLLLLARGSLIPVYWAALVLIVLLLDVAVVMPGLMIEAFNPVSVNVLGLFTCLVIVRSQETAGQSGSSNWSS